MQKSSHLKNTIFAPITSIHSSAVTVIRISGSKTKYCLNALGIKNNLNPRQILLQKIIINQTLIDEALVVFFNAPHSFTGEDVAEISIHSSPFILQQITSCLLTISDVSLALPGEFSKQAFYNNKLDLVQAEAIVDLINSETATQHKQALNQMKGGLSTIYFQWRKNLLEISSLLTAIIDFPEDDLPQELQQNINQQINHLTSSIYQHLNDNLIGQKIKDGLSLAIIGATNVGKSSLINHLSNSEVAIVSPYAGTTRDVIEVHLHIADMMVKIADTAGIRNSKNAIEKIGITKSLQKAKTSDLKILVIDATNPKLPQHFINEFLPKNTLIVINKIDQEKSHKLTKILSLLQKKQFDVIEISLLQNINILNLKQALHHKVKNIIPSTCHNLITNQRYRLALQNTLQALQDFCLLPYPEIAFENLRIASNELGFITGKITSEDLLDQIFTKFCIGK
jgi:tRNA modification GTPase